MRLLYCYTEFLDGKGEPKPFRGLDKIDLNLSADLIFKYDKEANRLDWGIRKNPLPPGFWANAAAQESERRWAKRGSEGIPEAPADGPAPETAPGPSFPFGELSTNIYNINVVAGRNGTGKSTVINYLIDLLEYVFAGFDENPRANTRFDVNANRNILVFERADRSGERKLYVVDIVPANRNNNAPRNIEVVPKRDDVEVVPFTKRAFINRQPFEEFHPNIKRLKTVYMTNALTQRDYERNADNYKARFRYNFVYDCSVGATIAPDAAQYFLYEVYKQVKYVFNAAQQDLRKQLNDCIHDELVLPRKLRIWPRFKLMDDFIKSELFDALHSSILSKGARSKYDYSTLSIRDTIGALCVSSNALNASRAADLPLVPQVLQTDHDNRLPIDIPQHHFDSFKLYSDDINGIEKSALAAIIDHNGGKQLYCMAVLEDGRIVTGGADNIVRIHDQLSGECQQALRGHSAPVNCVAVLTDGRIVSGSSDNTIRIWDPGSGVCTNVLTGHNGAVYCLAISPDGWIISGSSDQTIRIWDPLTSELRSTLNGQYGPVTGLAVLPNGYIVFAANDHYIHVWSIQNGRIGPTYGVGSYNIRCILPLNNRIIAFCSSDDAAIRIMDLSNGSITDKFSGHFDSVTGIALLPDGRIVSSSRDKTLRIWDRDSGECLSVLVGHSGRVNCVAVDPEGKIISASHDGTIRLWQSDSGKCVGKIDSGYHSVFCFAETPDRHILCGSSDGVFRSYNIDSCDYTNVFNNRGEHVRCMTLLKGRKAVSGYGDNTLCIWNAKTGNIVTYLKGHHGAVNCVVSLPDGRIVSGSFDHTLRVWETQSGKSLELKGHTLAVTCVDVLPDGRIVSGSGDKTLRIWDIEKEEKCVNTIEGHSAWINCVITLRDGRIISGSDDTTLRIWDPNNNSFVKLGEHDGAVCCVARLSNDRIVSGSDDNTLRIWDTKTHECAAVLEGHLDRIRCVTELSDGRIASGSEDGTIRIWNAETYECEVILGPDRRIRSIHSLTVNSQNFIRFLRGNEENFNHFRRVPNEKCCFEIDVRGAEDPEGLAEFMNEFMEKYLQTCRPEYTVDFDWGLSSGEQNMLKLFSCLYHIYDHAPESGHQGEQKIFNRKEPGSRELCEEQCDSVLLFLDEADLTLHPEWQRRLIHVLTAFIPGIYPPSCAKDVQIVLSTHSPLLLGDVPKENVYYLGRNSGDPTETFGQNIHTILKDGFFLDHGTVGEFAAARINHTAKRLGEIIKHEKAELYRKKEAGGGSGAAQAETLSGSARGEYVRPDTEELAAIRQTIDLVAEGILRARLESMWLEADALLGPAADSDEVKELLQRIGELSPEGLRQLERGLINAKGANGK